MQILHGSGVFCNWRFVYFYLYEQDCFGFSDEHKEQVFVDENEIPVELYAGKKKTNKIAVDALFKQGLYYTFVNIA